MDNREITISVKTKGARATISYLPKGATGVQALESLGRWLRDKMSKPKIARRTVEERAITDRRGQYVQDGTFCWRCTYDVTPNEELIELQRSCFPRQIKGIG